MLWWHVREGRRAGALFREPQGTEQEDSRRGPVDGELGTEAARGPLIAPLGDPQVGEALDVGGAPASGGHVGEGRLGGAQPVRAQRQDEQRRHLLPQQPAVGAVQQRVLLAAGDDPCLEQGHRGGMGPVPPGQVGEDAVGAAHGRRSAAQRGLLWCGDRVNAEVVADGTFAPPVRGPVGHSVPLQPECAGAAAVEVDGLVCPEPGQDAPQLQGGHPHRVASLASVHDCQQQRVSVGRQSQAGAWVQRRHVIHRVLLYGSPVAHHGAQPRDDLAHPQLRLGDHFLGQAEPHPVFGAGGEQGATIGVGGARPPFALAHGQPDGLEGARVVEVAVDRCLHPRCRGKRARASPTLVRPGGAQAHAGVAEVDGEHVDAQGVGGPPVQVAHAGEGIRPHVLAPRPIGEHAQRDER